MSLPFDPLTDRVEQILDDQTEWRHNAMRVIELQQREIDLLHEQVQKRDKIIEQQEELLDSLYDKVDRFVRIREREKSFWAWHAIF